MCALCIPGRALAQEEVDAESMELASKAYQDGMRAYQEQDYERAIQALRLSYTIVADPMILYNIAIIEVDAGRHDAALSTMAQARQEGLPAEEDAKTAARAHAVRSLLQARRVAPRIGSAPPSDTRSLTSSKQDERQPLWPPLLVTAAGGAALLGAASIEFRIIEQRVELDQHAQQGDGPAYKAGVTQIQTLQRRGKIALLSGSLLAVGGLTWTAWRVSKNAQSEPDKTGSLQITPQLDRHSAGMLVDMSF